MPTERNVNTFLYRDGQLVPAPEAQYPSEQELAAWRRDLHLETAVAHLGEDAGQDAADPWSPTKPRPTTGTPEQRATAAAAAEAKRLAALAYFVRRRPRQFARRYVESYLS